MEGSAFLKVAKPSVNIRISGGPYKGLARGFIA
jgi:hypothetical protein